LVLVLVVLISLIGLAAGNAAPANPEVARVAAQGHIDAVALDFPADFAGARVAGAPTLGFDLDGNPSAFIFDVAKNGRTVGYVTVGADDNGPLVIESSAATSPVEKRLMFYKASGKSEAELAADLARGMSALYYLGGIEYYMAVPDDQKAALGSEFVNLANFSAVKKEALLRAHNDIKASLSEPQKKARFSQVWQAAAAGPASRQEAPAANLKAGTIQVIWPSAPNQYMIRGSRVAYNITWSASGVANVRIDLYKSPFTFTTLAASVPAGQGSFPYRPSSTIVPGPDYKIKITDTANAGVYDYSDNYFYISGSKIVPGCVGGSAGYAYTWYRGCVITAETMSVNYVGAHGFPDLYYPVTTAPWNGPGGVSYPTIARGLADRIGNAIGVPQSGGTVGDYGVDLIPEVNGVRAAINGLGYGLWNTLYAFNPSAETYRGVVDKNRPGQMGFYGGQTTYNNHATLFMGYAFYANLAALNQRTIYVYNTWDLNRHDVVYENQHGTGNILDYHETNPPMMVVKYPSAAGITLAHGQAVTVKWGSWASQTGHTNVRIELIKDGIPYDTVALSTPNDGSFLWYPKYTLPTSSYYRIRVRSATDSSVTDDSNNHFTISGSVPPPAPTNVAASDGSYYDRVLVAWNASPLATGYKVFRNTANNSAGATQIATPAGSPYSDFTATPGLTYFYWVKAVVPGYGDSGFSIGNSGYRHISPPQPPTNVFATDGTKGHRVDVSWSAPSNATSYKIFRSTTNNTATAKHIVSSFYTSYSDYTVTPTVVCYYWIKATNAGGDSAFSNGDSGYWNPAPQPPTNVRASDGTAAGRVYVTWTAPLYATGYKIFRNTANNSAGAVRIGTTIAGSYSDYTAVANVTYYYWIKATNASGESGFSNGDRGYRIPPPPAPTNVRASDGTYGDRVLISWTAVSGAIGYKVYRNATNTTVGAVMIGTATASPYSDLYAAQGAMYYYWVKAVNLGGDSGFSTSDRGMRGTGITSLAVNGIAWPGLILPARDVDIYQFTATVAGTYTIETWAGTLTDNYMYLYGPNSQTTLIATDDNSGTGNMAKITRSLSPGVYYVKIRAASTTATGTYTIRVTK
jgi:hypothetical protein